MGFWSIIINFPPSDFWACHVNSSFIEANLQEEIIHNSVKNSWSYIFDTIIGIFVQKRWLIQPLAVQKIHPNQTLYFVNLNHLAQSSIIRSGTLVFYINSSDMILFSQYLTVLPSSALKAQHILSSVHFALLKNVHGLYQAHAAPSCTSRVGFYSEYISSNTKYTLMTAHSVNSYLYFSNL